MPKFYTGNGDSGSTGLLGVANVQKSNPIVSAIGDIDELNSSIGMARFYVHNEFVRKELTAIQNDLFSIGAMMASALAVNIPNKVVFGEEATKRLEDAIAEMSSKLPELKEFVLPGGCEGSVHLHVSRAIARRAERSLVAAAEIYKGKIDANLIKYVNRLSSFLFAAALYLNNVEGIDEMHPVYRNK
ncbi:MAG: cob(I)yrinic acid a,c-diamide adenosyltransferase [Candidatus Micrarchaeia archaeon]